MHTCFPDMARTTRLLLLCLCLAAPMTHAALKPGDTLPDLSTFGLEGDLPTVQGKVVLLDFWASWCAPCRTSFPAMTELQTRYGAQGFTIIAVNVDDKPGKMEKFLQRTNAGFPVVRDAQQQLVATAEPTGMPTTIIVGKDGKIRSVHVGYHGDETKAAYAAEIEALLAE